MQTLVAMSEVTNKISHNEGPCASLNVQPMQYDRFLVISLGTGSQKQEPKYSAKDAAEWGTLSWVSPLIDAFGQASSDMVDFHISSVFRALKSEHNYLRIQVFIIPHYFYSVVHSKYILIMFLFIFTNESVYSNFVGRYINWELIFCGHGHGGEFAATGSSWGITVKEKSFKD